MSMMVLNHILKSLKEHNLIAYEYDVETKLYQWVGDVFRYTGIAEDVYPSASSDFDKMIHPQDLPERSQWLYSIRNQSESTLAEYLYKLKHSNGAFVDVKESVEYHPGENGQAGKITGTIEFLDMEQSDIKVKDKLEGISGLKTPLQSSENGRRTTKYKIEQWLDAQTDENRPQGFLLIVGIDRLSLYNEFIGLDETDEIILLTGKRLQTLFGDQAEISRIAGDIYSILMPYDKGNEMSSVASLIINSFYEDPIMLSSGPLIIGVSVGGVVITKENKWNAASFITKGELAMQTAKEQGRGRYVPYNAAASYAAKQHSTLELGTTFLHALKEGRLHLAFQPIVQSSTSGVSFHECLLRMLDNNGRLISAGDFIPAIEKLGMAPFLDQYTLRLAIQELMMFPDLTLSVNVSKLNLVHQDWLRSLVGLLRECPQVAQRLIIEVTETAFVESADNIAKVINTLKDLGCRIALDDFGAGYTSFSHIKDLQVDIVKIDKSFIRNIDQKENAAFIKTLQNLAHSVHFETVAEGAETMAEARNLVNEGVDYIQGYAYGFPEVERVWLPTDHHHRKIIKPGVAERNQNAYQAMTQDQMLSDLKKMYKD